MKTETSLICRAVTGPYLGPLASGERPGWAVWGNQADETYAPTWKTHSYNYSVAA